MTVATKARAISTATTSATKSTASIVTKAKPFAFKGKDRLIRAASFESIASLSYVEGISRADTVANLKRTLGAKPTDAEIKACQLEWVAGRAAQRFAPADLPLKDMSIADRIAFARTVIGYAAPPQDGVKAKKVADRRTVAQHKTIRAAESAWSLMKAEVIPSTTLTLKEKNAKQAKRGTKSTLPVLAPITHSEVAHGDKAVTPASAMEYLTEMSGTLEKYGKKHAKVIPTDFGAALVAFRTAILKAKALADSVAE